MLQNHLIYFLLQPRSSHLLWGCSSLLESGIWSHWECSLLLGWHCFQAFLPNRGRGGNICVCVLYYSYVYPSVIILEFMCMSPTLIQCHVDHASILLLLLCSLSFQQLKMLAPTLTVHLLNCSAPVHMYSGFRIFHLNHCGEKTSSTGIQCLYTYFFPLILQILLTSTFLD